MYKFLEGRPFFADKDILVKVRENIINKTKSTNVRKKIKRLPKNYFLKRILINIEIEELFLIESFQVLYLYDNDVELFFEKTFIYIYQFDILTLFFYHPLIR